MFLNESFMFRTGFLCSESHSAPRHYNNVLRKAHTENKDAVLLLRHKPDKILKSLTKFFQEKKKEKKYHH